MSSSSLELQIGVGRARLERLREAVEERDDELLWEILAGYEEALSALERAAADFDVVREELTEAQQAVALQTERYHELFRFAPDAYVITDALGVVIDANAWAEEKLGYEASYLFRKPLLPLVIPSDRSAFLECLSRIRSRRISIDDALLSFRPGRPFTAAVSAVPRKGVKGLEIQWTLRDVSAVQQRDAFRSALEQHLDAVVWLIEFEPLRVLHVSDAFESIWGRPVGFRLSSPRAWLQTVVDEDREQVEAAFAALLDGRPYDEEYRIRRPDGEERWIHDRGTPFGDVRESAVRAAGIAEDVTARKRSEAALVEANRLRRVAALAAERAESRERRSLARDLHDAVSQSLALALAKTASLRNEMREAGRSQTLEEIEMLIAEADERTRTLTFQLSPPILQDIGVVAAAEWLMDELRRGFGLRARLVDAAFREPDSFEIRETLFRSLRELLINVARHAKTPEVEVQLGCEGEAAVVHVVDRGVGFEARSSRRDGFGLVNTRERIEMLGGCMEIDSRPGYGTQVRLVVPFRDPME